MPGEEHFRDGSGRHARDGLASRGAPAAADVAESELAVPREIGVSGPEKLRDGIVVGAVLIGIAENDRDGCACGDAVEHAGKDFGGVGLRAGRGHAGLSGPAAREFTFEEFEVDREPRRDAVDDAPERGTVGFSECGDAEERAEGV